MTDATRLVPYAGFDPTEAPLCTRSPVRRPAPYSPRRAYARPEPTWWARARALEGRGLSRAQIAEATGKSIFTVANALDPVLREKRKGYCRAAFLRERSL